VADITVTVSSPGLIAFGESNFGNNTFGGEGFSLPLSQGSAELIFSSGWGSNEWGQYTWGIVGDIAVITGSQLNVSIGNETTVANANVDVTGQQLNTTINNVTTTATANIDITGSRINVLIGNEVATADVSVSVTTAGRLNVSEGNVIAEGEIRAGWGVYTWGTVPWGGDQDASANVTGTQLVSRIGAEDIQIDGNITLNLEDNAQLAISINGVTPRTDVSFAVTTAGRLNVLIGEEVVVVNVTVPVTGSRLNTAVGQVIGGTQQIANVTGSQVNVSVGNTDEFAGATVNVTGSRLNVAPGQIKYEAGYNVTGSRANLSVGTVTFVISGSTTVTGSRLNISEGSANTTSWQEVNTGVNNNWTPVDLAA
jgi:hypothetical protein